MLVIVVYQANKLCLILNEVIATKILRSSSQSGWPLRNIHMTMNLLLFACRFLSSITAKTFTGLECMYEYHGRCLIRSRNCLPFASPWVHPRFFSGVRVAHLLSFLCCIIMCLYLLSSMLWFQLQNSAQKRCSTRLYLQLFFRAHVLFMLFVFCV